jgi:hypothetical protein
VGGTEEERGEKMKEEAGGRKGERGGKRGRMGRKERAEKREGKYEQFFLRLYVGVRCIVLQS